ncbi:MAG: biotin--[acetyl-CoA-carboxylase] ligase [Bacteroidales bacterium]|nr:biotin--[acetyl-CoA-carboxylase] ligase [Bacteroidales bacterium]
MTPEQSASAIIWTESAESTNKSMKEMAGTAGNLSVIAAVEQTAGRGQGSHSWHSLKGQNLTFSMLCKPSCLHASDVLLITCAVTLGIRDYLLGNGVEARIKWPNDIWVGEKKICGILIENSVESGEVRSSIIGVGLNLNQCEWPEELPNPVSLRQITGKSYGLREELEAVSARIGRRLSLMDSDAGRSELQEEFGKYVFRLPEDGLSPQRDPEI